jgi:hypothetical protein
MCSVFTGKQKHHTGHLVFAICFHTCFLLCPFLDPEDGGDMFPETSVDVQLHSVISQKIKP